MNRAFKSTLLIQTGVIALKETTKPDSVANYGQFYNKVDGLPYFVSSAGNEKSLGLTSIVWSVVSTATDMATGHGYFCDTSSAGFTVTMPATPTIGAVVWINDLATSFSIAGKELTINFNGEKHQGVTGTYTANSFFDEMMCWVYSNSTYGWKRVVK